MHILEQLVARTLCVAEELFTYVSYVVCGVLQRDKLLRADDRHFEYMQGYVPAADCTAESR